MGNSVLGNKRWYIKGFAHFAQIAHFFSKSFSRILFYLFYFYVLILFFSVLTVLSVQKY